MSKKFNFNIDFPEIRGDRTLVWGDCFNCDDYDKEIWTPVNWNVSDITQELSDKTYYFKDGQLVLFSTKLNPEDVKDGKEYYTPSFLTTKDKMEFKYGYFEIKAQIPFYKGNSGAFWFVSTQKTETGYSSEIDMVELLGSENNVVSNLHAWGANHASHDAKVKRADRSHTFDSSPEDLRNEMHTYFMDWSPDHIDFGVDNQVYFRAGLNEKDKDMFANPVDMDVFRLPVYFILSEYLYTPGRKLGWGLKGDEDPFKYVMKVEHVALYQKEGEEIYFK